MIELNQLADLFANPPKKLYKGVQSQSHYQTMRDRTQIAVDLLRPANLEADTRLPLVMIMARYWRSMELRLASPPRKAPIGPREAIADYLIARGFAVVIVDARGTGASTGVNLYPWSADELADYGEIAAWAMEQPWCSGKIGAVGLSYEGSTAQYLLASGVKGVTSAAPMAYEFDVYTDIALPGGIFNTAFIQQWSESNARLDHNKTSRLFPWLARLMVKGVRPVDADRQSRAILNQALHDHQANTDVYAAISQITFRDDRFGDTGQTLDDFSVFARQAAIEASGGAMFVWGSWLDGTTADTVLRSFNTLSNPQIGVIGAWKHEMTAHGSPYTRPKSKPSPLQEQQWAAVTKFFEQTLKTDQPGVEKTLFYYMLGAEEWRQTTTFPLPNTEQQTWYFQDDKELAPTPPSVAATDTYSVDFAATTGQTNRWHTQMARPLHYPDRAQADLRLLTYTSAPLEHNLEIIGYPVVTLYVASTEDDGAFYVYLEDVDEQGVVRYITEGQLRGIHRQLAVQPAPYWMGMPNRSFKRDAAAPLPRNTFVELTIGLQPTSVLIRRGHRIRVALAGADRDTFMRIPAQGTPVWQVGRSTALASCISLPVVR
ncbi:MAG: CocE/NonD family hydrolase [Herpetosiphonaceae bacterium]|nr:CocE/NonD family hydrolase [Herpetosiphonaceae bacterium]